MLQFQNCSQTQFSKTLGSEAGKVSSQVSSTDPVTPPGPGGPCVIVTDRDNNVVLIEGEKDPVSSTDPGQPPVVVTDPDKNVNTVSIEPKKDPVSSTDPGQPPVVVTDPDKNDNTVSIEPKKDPVKVIDNVVSNIEDSQDPSEGLSCNEMSKKYKNKIDISKLTDGKISYLRGKNFLYSSTGYSTFGEVEIDNANGRTILCGVHIRRIKMKVGRLDLIKSTVDVIEKQSGVIRQDSDSLIRKLN
ncbi:MAG: hypothetical protein H7Z71_08790 [Moraxellaceae bacterium]|nr:hypothetical protein [Pseudobdellovibrionaceae bacterium]